MNIDPNLIQNAATAAGTVLTMAFTLGQYFKSTFEKLNGRIDNLSMSINALEKNVAVQTALFDQIYNKGRKL